MALSAWWTARIGTNKSSPQGSQRNTGDNYTMISPVYICAPCGKDFDSDFAPEFFPRILWIQLGQLPQQFFGLFVARHGDGDLHLDDLIPADAVFGSRRHAFFAQPKLLAGLRPRMNLQHASAVNGGHFDLRSQRRFHRRHRHRDVDVVTLAVEERMFADADDDVEIADSAPAQPGIAFARDANALPVAGSGLDAYFERIGALDA